jgi:hypothetical protein
VPQSYGMCSARRRERVARIESCRPALEVRVGRTELVPYFANTAASTAFRVDVPDRNILDAARERLRLRQQCIFEVP